MARPQAQRYQVMQVIGDDGGTTGGFGQNIRDRMNVAGQQPQNCRASRDPAHATVEPMNQGRDGLPSHSDPDKFGSCRSDDRERGLCATQKDGITVAKSDFLSFLKGYATSVDVDAEKEIVARIGALQISILPKSAEPSSKNASAGQEAFDDLC